MYGEYVPTSVLHLVEYVSCTAGCVLSLAGYVPSLGGVVWSSRGDAQSPEGNVGHVESVMSPGGHSCVGGMQ
jgi:hypothetical protein